MRGLPDGKIMHEEISALSMDFIHGAGYVQVLHIPPLAWLQTTIGSNCPGISGTVLDF